MAAAQEACLVGLMVWLPVFSSEGKCLYQVLPPTHRLGTVCSSGLGASGRLKSNSHSWCHVTVWTFIPTELGSIPASLTEQGLDGLLLTPLLGKTHLGEFDFTKKLTFRSVISGKSHWANHFVCAPEKSTGHLKEEVGHCGPEGKKCPALDVPL